MGFPIGGQSEPTVYLAWFLRLSFKGIVVTTLTFGKRDVIGHVTNGFPRCHFLLVVSKNRPCISHGC